MVADPAEGFSLVSHTFIFIDRLIARSVWHRVTGFCRLARSLTAGLPTA